MHSEPNRLLESAKIVALCIFASIVYGILHDQVTIRLCPEYFTKWAFHADVFSHPNLTVVALFWGFAATWWVGLLLGIPIAFVSTTRDAGWWTWRQLVKPLFVFITLLSFCAAVGYFISMWTSFQVNPYALNYFPDSEAELSTFSRVLVTHNVSYIGGAIGGLVLVGFVWKRRSKQVWQSIFR